MSVDDFRPGTTPPAEAYFSPSDFTDTAGREALADEIEAVNVASVFIRFESGHSNETVPKHPLFNSSEFPNNYLLHGTHLGDPCPCLRFKLFARVGIQLANEC